MVVPPTRPRIDSAPTQPDDVPEAHKGILALVHAHSERYKEAVEWPLLQVYVEHAANEEPDGLPLGEELGHAGLPLILSRVVGDLVDFQVLEPTNHGLAFSSSGASLYGQILSLDGDRARAADIVVGHVNDQLDDDAGA
jgi:hypothetical protein